jgi:hypothetical protein
LEEALGEVKPGEGEKAAALESNKNELLSNPESNEKLLFWENKGPKL